VAAEAQQTSRAQEAAMQQLLSSHQEELQMLETEQIVLQWEAEAVSTHAGVVESELRREEEGGLERVAEAVGEVESQKLRVSKLEQQLQEAVAKTAELQQTLAASEEAKAAAMSQAAKMSRAAKAAMAAATAEAEHSIRGVQCLFLQRAEREHRGSRLRGALNGWAEVVAAQIEQALEAIQPGLSVRRELIQSTRSGFLRLSDATAPPPLRRASKGVGRRQRPKFSLKYFELRDGALVWADSRYAMGAGAAEQRFALAGAELRTLRRAHRAQHKHSNRPQHAKFALVRPSAAENEPAGPQEAQNACSERTFLELEVDCDDWEAGAAEVAAWVRVLNIAIRKATCGMDEEPLAEGAFDEMAAAAPAQFLLDGPLRPRPGEVAVTLTHSGPLGVSFFDGSRRSRGAPPSVRCAGVSIVDAVRFD
jgi:hypothetical protein